MIKKDLKYLYYLVMILLIIVELKERLYCYFVPRYNNKTWDITVISIILFAFSIINIIFIILSENKKKYFFHICSEILRFLILNTFLALIISIIIWIKRDKALIDITSMEKFTFPYVFFHLSISISLISCIFILAWNIKKSLKINKDIFFLLFPAKYFIIFFIFLSLFGLKSFETLCPWNPLIDTIYSDTFNIYNIDKIEDGMSKEEILELIGEPLYIGNEENIEELIYTGDGKCIYGDYAWFPFRLKFKDNILIEKESFWAFD